MKINLFQHLSLFSQQQLTACLKWAIGIYILSIGFLSMPTLPVVGNKLQLPEFIFLILILPLLVILGLGWKKFRFNQLKINLFDKGVICYIIGLILSTVLGHHTGSIGQLSGIFYLTMLALAIKYLIYINDDLKTIDNHLLNAFKGLGIWLSVFTIGGWLWWYFGFGTTWVRVLHEYIYFGACARALATTRDANMLASILISCFAVTFMSGYYRGNLRQNSGILALFGVALLLTMSKAILLLSIVPLIIGKPNIWITRIFAGCAVFLLLWVTHFYSTRHPLDLKKINNSGSFVCAPHLFQIGPWTIYPTSYSNNKRVSYKAFKNNPFYGIGLDKQESYAAQLQKKGEYPIYFSPLDSHCSYTGAFAEGGILGGFGFLILILFGFIAVKRTWLDTPFMDTQFIVGIGAITILGIAAIESWTLETNTFRHYWVAIGLFSGYLDQFLLKKLRT